MWEQPLLCYAVLLQLALRPAVCVNGGPEGSAMMFNCQWAVTRNLSSLRMAPNPQHFQVIEAASKSVDTHAALQ